MCAERLCPSGSRGHHIRGLTSIWLGLLVGCSGPNEQPRTTSHAGPINDALTLRASYVAARQAEGILDERYWLRRTPDVESTSLLAENPTMKLVSELRSDGVRVATSEGPWNATLILERYGCNEAAEPILRNGSGPLVEEAHRAAYVRWTAHERLREWYANGPLGLEQGFTLERSPCTSGGAAIVIEIGVQGLGAALGAGAAGIELRDGTGAAGL